jgi:hypothetical protein
VITPETALKLKELGFPLVSVGKEDHAYAAEFCRFCGFPFLKIADTYYLMPTVNTLIGVLDKNISILSRDMSQKPGEHWHAETYGCTARAGDPDEALGLLWISLKVAKAI